jgi:hypothetical protein
MDSLITAAARGTCRRDPLSALKRVALLDDAPAVAFEPSQLGAVATPRSDTARRSS